MSDDSEKIYELVLRLGQQIQDFREQAGIEHSELQAEFRRMIDELVKNVDYARALERRVVNLEASTTEAGHALVTLHRSGKFPKGVP